MLEDRPLTGDERAQLTATLDEQRDAVLRATEGLSREQLRQRLPPGDLTLAGLLAHLTLVEDSWFSDRFAGLPSREPWASVDWAADPDWEFRTAVNLAPATLRSEYQAAGARSREIAAAAPSLEALSVGTVRGGQRFDLRWVLLHLVEETARHAGHADLLREAVDGTRAS